MYKVLLSDNPWKFRNEKTGGNHTSGAVQKYPVMELGEIMALPVQSVMATPSVCFLWVPTSMKFSHGGPVLTSWGYAYKTSAYWDKQKLGMGFWFRNQVEELLIGIRGDFPPFGCQLPNIIHQPPGEHSAKPDEFYRLIETATGITSSRYNLEMFARRRVPGWAGIGNQVTGRTVQQDLLRLARAKRCPAVNLPGTPATDDTIPKLCMTCGGAVEEHAAAVIDAFASGHTALFLRGLGDQAAGR